jgi:hypothetical protein
VGSAYRQDAVCCKRYNISAKHFSVHGSVDEDIFSEEQVSALESLYSCATAFLRGKVWLINGCRR